jgi:hypothetical protein
MFLDEERGVCANPKVMSDDDEWDKSSVEEIEIKTTSKWADEDAEEEEVSVFFSLFF